MNMKVGKGGKFSLGVGSKATGIGSLPNRKEPKVSSGGGGKLCKKKKRRLEGGGSQESNRGGEKMIPL